VSEQNNFYLLNIAHCSCSLFFIYTKKSFFEIFFNTQIEASAVAFYPGGGLGIWPAVGAARKFNEITKRAKFSQIGDFNEHHANIVV